MTGWQTQKPAVRPAQKRATGILPVLGHGQDLSRCF